MQSTPWELTLRAGDRLGFLLRANPTVARSAGPGMRGKRHDVVIDALRDVPAGERAAVRREVVFDAGRAWLTRQGVRAGFTPDPDALRIDGYDTVRIPRGERDAVEYGQLEFEGVLEVTDSSPFLAAVVGGFGRARAFGCGLMLLRRAAR